MSLEHFERWWTVHNFPETTKEVAKHAWVSAEVSELRTFLKFKEELTRYSLWFHTVQEVAPLCLTKKDYELGEDMDAYLHGIAKL